MPLLQAAIAANNNHYVFSQLGRHWENTIAQWEEFPHQQSQPVGAGKKMAPSIAALGYFHTGAGGVSGKVTLILSAHYRCCSSAFRPLAGCF